MHVTVMLESIQGCYKNNNTAKAEALYLQTRCTPHTCAISHPSITPSKKENNNRDNSIFIYIITDNIVAELSSRPFRTY